MNAVQSARSEITVCKDGAGETGFYGRPATGRDTGTLRDTRVRVLLAIA